MTSVLLLCPEQVRPNMAGVGIRFVEIARSLADRFEVVLGIPNPTHAAPELLGVEVVQYGIENMGHLSRSADAVMVHGHVSDAYLDHASPRPLVVDLYDPFPIENLNYFDTLGDEPYRRDRATLERQLRHGDLFLCSSEEQRLFFLGMLYVLGRLNPQRYFDDFALANLVRIVPFGLPEEPPASTVPVLRGVVPGIGDNDPVLLFGGIYDWYDPLLLLRALPAVLRRHPDLRVVFAANPNPESTPQGLYGEVLEACNAARWTDRNVFFVPWVPYHRRAGLYLESTVAAVLHRPRFETEVSMRTRALEYLWAGLPTVLTAGGAMSRIAVEESLALVIAEGDCAALGDALVRLLDQEQLRQRLGERGRDWASRNTWSQVLEPLVSYLADPRQDPDKGRYQHDELLVTFQPPGRLRRLARRFLNRG